MSLPTGRGPAVDANIDRLAVSGIALVDPAGNILVATRGMPPLESPAHRALLSPQRGDRGLLDIAKTPGGELVVGFSVPVYAVHEGRGAARPLGRIVGIRPG